MTDRNKDDNLEFEKVALPYLDNIYRAAVALCGQSSEAEDLTQTTFLKAFEKFNTFVPGTDCKSWLMRILRNVWGDRLRRKSAAGTQVPLDESSIAEPEIQESPVWSNAEDLLQNFSDAQIIKALHELSDDQRLTLFLVDVERLSVQETAGVLGVAVGTVKSRSNRARGLLKERLAAHARDLGYLGREK